MNRRPNLRVVQLGAYPPPHGGVQTNVASLHQRLLDNGHRSFVINLTRNRQTDTANLFFPHTALQVCSRLLSLPVDIAHFHIGGDITNRLVGLAAFLRMFPGRKAVATLHSGGFPASVDGQPSNRLQAIRFVFRHFDALIAVNPELQAFWNSSGIAPRRVHLIEPFPRVQASDLSVSFSPAVQAFCQAHAPLLVTVGLLEPEYDLPLQIAALRQIRLAYPNAGLLIAGSGSLQAELERRIANEPASESILLAGDQPHPITLELIRRAGVLLRTTLYDGDSIAIREALQLGTPVVATDNGMRPDHVNLAPIGDVNAVAKQALAVLASPRSQDQNSTEAKQTDGIDSVLELYQSLYGASTE